MKNRLMEGHHRENHDGTCLRLAQGGYPDHENLASAIVLFQLVIYAA